MDQSDKKDDIGNITRTPTPTDNDENGNSSTGSTEHLLTPPEGQIPPRPQGQPQSLLFDQFMREAFAQLSNNPGFYHHLPFTPGDFGGPSHGHGNTGSNEPLLPPPSWGQMPQQHQQGPPNQMQQNPFNQQDFTQHLEQLINESMRQQISNVHYSPPTSPFSPYLDPTAYRDYRKPRNFTCSACNHEDLSVVRLIPSYSVLCWPISLCLGKCACIFVGMAWLFITIASHDCPQPSGICPLTITLTAILIVVTLFCCLYPCFLRRYWDACHYCSNCNKCLKEYSGKSLDWCECCPCRDA